MANITSLFEDGQDQWGASQSTTDSEDRFPFAIDHLEDTFLKGSYQGVSFDGHAKNAIRGYMDTMNESESIHEFYYQEIKELLRLNTQHERIYVLDPNTRFRLEQIILKHSRNIQPLAVKRYNYL